MSRKIYLLREKTSERVTKMLKQHENMTVTGGRRILSNENSHLAIDSPADNGGGVNLRPIPAQLSQGDVLPTQSTIRNAILAAYANTEIEEPLPGDLIVFTQLHYLVASDENSVSENGIFVVKFQVEEHAMIAIQVGPNRLF